MPGDQDELIEEIGAVNDDTVVVVQSSGPVECPWHDDVRAVFETWYPGEADGNALAAVLFGDSDPGGRLPVTFANEADYPLSDAEAFPGTDVASTGEGVRTHRRRESVVSKASRLSKRIPTEERKLSIPGRLRGSGCAGVVSPECVSRVDTVSVLSWH